MKKNNENLWVIRMKNGDEFFLTKEENLAIQKLLSSENPPIFIIADNNTISTSFIASISEDRRL